MLAGAAKVNPGVGTRARWAFFFRLGTIGEQSYNAAQAFPRRLIQALIRTHQAANHVPGGDVQRAFGRQSHGQRNRTLRAETDAMGRRFLPRLDAYGLREHVYSDRFVPAFELPIAAKTKQVFQAILPAAAFGLAKYKHTFARGLTTQQVCRKIPAEQDSDSSGVTRLL